LFRLLADERVRWILAGTAAFSSITFFFQTGRGAMAFLAALLSFVALPAGIMAGSMADRGMPRGPVLSAVAGAAFGLSYGVAAGLAALGSAGPFGVLGLLAFVIIAPLVGFTLLGGVANMVTSRNLPPPDA
jgi:hypothetical protein